MRVKGALSFIAFAIIFAFAYAYFTSMGVAFRPSRQQTHLSMEIPDINGLVVGSSVQLRGVPIGEVSHITTDVAGATVSFSIDGRYKIPIDSDVRLENLSALGEAYIGLVPRSEGGPNFRDGQHIAAEAVTQPPSVSELATSVVRVLNQLDPEALQSIISETDVAFPNPTEVLPNLSRTSMLLRNTTANMNGKGNEVLANFQALLHNAQFVGPVLAFNTPYLTMLGKDFDGINNSAVTLTNRGAPQTLHDLAHLVHRIQHLLDHSSGDIKVLTQTMLPYLNDISGALMNLDTGQILSNMLAAVPEDGAVTLHVTIPDADTATIPLPPPGQEPVGGATGTAIPPSPVVAPAPLTGASISPPAVERPQDPGAPSAEGGAATPGN